MFDLKESLEEWKFDDGDYHGSKYNVAVKEVTVNNKKKKMFAIIIRDTYNCKQDKVILRMFACGQNHNLKNNSRWVAYRSRQSVDCTTCFYDGKFKRDNKKEEIENKLSRTCEPLTYLQRTAEWFLLKSFLITGTMASKMQHVTCVKDITKEMLRDLLDQCIHSWFGRHVVTDSMVIGSENEKPTVEAFKKLDFVESFYDIGLIRMKDKPYIGVSPDGVCCIKHSGVMVWAIVEIKTHVKEKQVDDKKNAEEFGYYVSCDYDDSLFKSCVLSQHRKQLLQQCIVTGLKHAIYV